MNQPKYLNTQQAAEFLGVNRRRIYHLVKHAHKNGLPVTRIGGLLCFRRDRLEQWEASCTRNASGLHEVR